jgi:hypothetical protein
MPGQSLRDPRERRRRGPAPPMVPRNGASPHERERAPASPPSAGEAPINTRRHSSALVTGPPEQEVAQRESRRAHEGPNEGLTSRCAS